MGKEMFIRSKYETTNGNNPVNVHKSGWPRKVIYSGNNRIDFGCEGEWFYDSKEDLHSEYEWILSQLDCRVNDGEEPEDSNILTHEYYLKRDLETNGPIGILKKGAVVAYGSEIDVMHSNEVIKVSYLDLKIWCDVGRLSKELIR